MIGLLNCASRRVRARLPHTGLRREGGTAQEPLPCSLGRQPLGGGLEVEQQILQGHGPERREALV